MCRSGRCFVRLKNLPRVPHHYDTVLRMNSSSQIMIMLWITFRMWEWFLFSGRHLWDLDTRTRWLPWIFAPHWRQRRRINSITWDFAQLNYVSLMFLMIFWVGSLIVHLFIIVQKKTANAETCGQKQTQNYFLYKSLANNSPVPATMEGRRYNLEKGF